MNIGQINEDISILIARAGSGKVARVKKDPVSVYEKWRAYRRFAGDTRPDPSFFVQYGISSPLERKYLHRIFGSGPEAIHAVAQMVSRNRSTLAQIIERSEYQSFPPSV